MDSGGGNRFESKGDSESLFSKGGHRERAATKDLVKEIFW